MRVDKLHAGQIAVLWLGGLFACGVLLILAANIETRRFVVREVPCTTLATPSQRAQCLFQNPVGNDPLHMLPATRRIQRWETLRPNQAAKITLQALALAIIPACVLTITWLWFGHRAAKL
jgi:hypothetical protein